MMFARHCLCIYSIYTITAGDIHFILASEGTSAGTSPLSSDIVSGGLTTYLPESQQSTTDLEYVYMTTESIEFSKSTENSYSPYITSEASLLSTEDNVYAMNGISKEDNSDLSTIDSDSLMGSTNELSTLQSLASLEFSTVQQSTMSEEIQTVISTASTQSDLITRSTIYRTLFTSTRTAYSSSQNTETTTAQYIPVTNSFGSRNELLILWGSVTGGIVLVVVIITIILVVCKKRKKLVDLNHGISLDTSYVMFSSPSESGNKDLDFDPIDLSHIYTEGTSVSVRPSAFSTLTFMRGRSKEGKYSNTSTENLVKKTKVVRTLSGPDVISSQIESNCLEEDNIEISTNCETVLSTENSME